MSLREMRKASVRASIRYFKRENFYQTKGVFCDELQEIKLDKNE